MRVAILAISIVVCTLLGCTLFWTSLRHEQDQELQFARDRGEARVSQLNAAVTQQFEGTLRSLDNSLAYLRVVRLKDPDRFAQAARQVLASYPKGMLDVIAVTDARGYLQFISDGTETGLYLGDREHFRVHAGSQEDRLFIGTPLRSRFNATLVIPLSRPIRDGERFLGAIIMPVKTSYVAETFGQLETEPEDLLALVRTDGHFLARNHRLEEALLARLPEGRPYLAAKPGETGMYRDISAVDKRELLYSWRRLADWPVSVVVGIDENSGLARMTQRQQQDRQHVGMAMALVSLFAIGVAGLLLRLGRNNARLLESETRFRNLIEKNGSVMLLVNPASGAILEANAAAAHFYGFTHAQLLAMTMDQIDALSEDEITRERQLAILEQRTYWNLVHRLARNELRDVEVYSTEIMLQGKTRLFLIVNDVTERRRSQARLARLTQEQEAILHSELVGFAMVRGRVMTWMNRAFAHALGYEPDELLGQSSRKLFQDEAAFFEFRERAYPPIEAGQVFRTEMPFRRKDGSSGWFDISGVQLYPGSEDLLWSFVDITAKHQLELERQRAEASLREAQQRLQASHDLLDRLSQNLPGVLFAYRLFPDGRSSFPYASQGMEKIYELQPRQVRDDATAAWKRVHPDDHDALMDALQQSARTLEARRFEFRVCLPRAGERWLHGQAKPERLDDGSVVWYGYVADVTGEKWLEQALRESEDQFRRAFENVNAGMFLVDLEGRILRVNAKAGEMFGYAPSELKGMAADQIALPEDAELTSRFIRQALGRGVDHGMFEKRYRHRNGQIVYGLVSLCLVFDAANKPLYFISQVQDITQRKLAEQALQLSLAKIERHDRQMVALNAMNERLMGCKHPQDAKAIIAASLQELFAPGRAAYRDGEPADEGLMRDPAAPQWMVSEQGDELNLSLPLRDSRLGVLCLGASASLSCDELEAIRTLGIAVSEAIHLALSNLMLQEDLRMQALRDPLTGLYNRRYLDLMLVHELDRCRRSGQALTLAMLDLDWFKRVNDGHGHEAGDAVLLALGHELTRWARSSDLVCRYGGEEFVLVLPGSSPDDVSARLQELLQRVEALQVQHEGVTLPRVTLSIGVAQVESEHDTASALLGRADVALYRAKQQGRNRVAS